MYYPPAMNKRRNVVSSTKISGEPTSNIVTARIMTRAIVALGGLSLGLVSACGSVQDRATEFALERIADGNVEIDSDGNRIVVSSEEGEFVIDTEDGSFRIEGSDGDGSYSIGGTDIPGEWSSLLSVYPGASVEAVQSFSGSDSVNQSVSISTSADPSEVVTYYVDLITRAGFTETYRADSNSGGLQQTMLTFDRNGSQVSLIATKSDGRTDATISLNQNN